MLNKFTHLLIPFIEIIVKALNSKAKFSKKSALTFFVVLFFYSVCVELFVDAE